MSGMLVTDRQTHKPIYSNLFLLRNKAPLFYFLLVFLYFLYIYFFTVEEKIDLLMDKLKVLSSADIVSEVKVKYFYSIKYDVRCRNTQLGKLQ